MCKSIYTQNSRKYENTLHHPILVFRQLYTVIIYGKVYPTYTRIQIVIHGNNLRGGMSHILDEERHFQLLLELTYHQSNPPPLPLDAGPYQVKGLWLRTQGSSIEGRAKITPKRSKKVNEQINITNPYGIEECNKYSCTKFELQGPNFIIENSPSYGIWDIQHGLHIQIFGIKEALKLD